MTDADRSLSALRELRTGRARTSVMGVGVCVALGFAGVEAGNEGARDAEVAAAAAAAGDERLVGVGVIAASWLVVGAAAAIGVDTASEASWGGCSGAWRSGSCAPASLAPIDKRTGDGVSSCACSCMTRSRSSVSDECARTSCASRSRMRSADAAAPGDPVPPPAMSGGRAGVTGAGSSSAARPAEESQRTNGFAMNNNAQERGTN